MKRSDEEKYTALHWAHYDGHRSGICPYIRACVLSQYVVAYPIAIFIDTPFPWSLLDQRSGEE